MKRNLLFIYLIAISVLPCNSQDSRDGFTNIYSFAKVYPVEYTEVKINDGVLAKIRNRSRDIGVPDYLQKFEDHGYIDNFRFVAENTHKPHFRGASTDEFVYKLSEAMGIYSTEDNKIAQLDKELSKTILSAQKEDGYLNTYISNPVFKEHGFLPFQKYYPDFSRTEDDIVVNNNIQKKGRMEFYNFAHFTQAAIEHYRSTGDRELLDASIKFADLIIDLFPDPSGLPYERLSIHKYIEHPNHELAMVELYRITGEKKYLDFVRQTFDEYDFDGPEFTEAHHHAVQEALFNAGAVSYYLETGEEKYMNLANRLWRDIKERKRYIIGGMGSTGKDERIEQEYHLPHETAYNETCAAISWFFWNHMMLLATGESKYADEMERSLYNNILAGYSLDGTHYFYKNVLKWTPESAKLNRENPRPEYHSCACCPPNFHRLMASLGKYIYTYSDNNLQINLFTNSEVIRKFQDGKIALEQQSDYPWNGNVKFKIKEGKNVYCNIEIRIPEWSKGATLKVNGEDQPIPKPGTYASITRKWSEGDIIELKQPLVTRIIEPNPQVESQQGKIALMRGPLVYCFEQSGNEGIDLLNLNYCQRAEEISDKYEPDLLGGVRTLKLTAHNNSESFVIQAIPYFSWANRDVGTMMVWLPVNMDN